MVIARGVRKSEERNGEEGQKIFLRRETRERGVAADVSGEIPGHE